MFYVKRFPSKNTAIWVSKAGKLHLGELNQHKRVKKSNIMCFVNINSEGFKDLAPVNVCHHRRNKKRENDRSVSHNGTEDVHAIAYHNEDGKRKEQAK